MQEEEKPKKNVRGPDKAKRNYGGGMPKKPEEEKAKIKFVSLTDREDDFLINKFGGRTKAIKTLLPKRLFPTKKK